MRSNKDLIKPWSIKNDKSGKKEQKQNIEVKLWDEKEKLLYFK